MANTGFKGSFCRQTGNQLVFRVLLTTADGTIVTSGTANLKLYELQSDGTLTSYDYSTNTFKTTTLTTQNLAMTHRQGNNGATSTGIWTAVLSTLTGFTIGGIYFAYVSHSSAVPITRMTEFQYGGNEGDGVVTQGTTGLGYNQVAVQQLDYSAINGTTRGFMSQSWLFATGATSPNISVTWTQAGITYNSHPVYSTIGGAGYYMWWSVSDGAWVISGAPGLFTSPYWVSSGNQVGPWAPFNSATGTPTFTAAGFPLSANWPSMSLDSSGRMLLQPVQTGVTIPTVTSLTTSPDSAGITSLLTRLSETRAGYLDKLNITGNVASAAAVAAIEVDCPDCPDIPDFPDVPTVVEIRQEMDDNSTKLQEILAAATSISPIPDLTPVDHNYGGENYLQYTDSSGNGIAGAKILIFTKSTYQRGAPVLPDAWAIGNTTTVANGYWANPIYLGIGNYVAVFSLEGEYAPTAAHFVVGDPIDTEPPAENSDGNSWLV